MTDAGGSLFTEPVLVVEQKAKLVEVTNEYALLDQHRRPVGAVRQVHQGPLWRSARLLTPFDQFLTHHLEVVDAHGTPVLTITRPARFLRSSVVVRDPAGEEIGRLVQQNVLGRVRFGLHADGRVVGSANAENRRGSRFSVRDHADLEVARITRTWAGLAATAFTTADSYVVQVHRPLEAPLAALVVAAAVGLDVALRQDRGGLV